MNIHAKQGDEKKNSKTREVNIEGIASRTRSALTIKGRRPARGTSASSRRPTRTRTPSTSGRRPARGTSASSRRPTRTRTPSVVVAPVAGRATRGKTSENMASMVACVNAAERRRGLGRRLGCGEYGCTYKITHNGDKVVRDKVVKVVDNIIAGVWNLECKMAREFGELGFGPKVHRDYICESKGYLEMDLVRMLTLDSTQVHLMDDKRQQEFVALIQRMVRSGFIHMDNHPGNLAINGEDKPVFIDFGFTQSRKFKSDADEIMAIAFSIYQIIEKVPYHHVHKTFFWKAAIKAHRLLTPEFLADVQAAKRRTKYRQLAKTQGSNGDLYVGCAIYRTFLEKAVSSRKGVGIDYVYDVRRGL